MFLKVESEIQINKKEWTILDISTVISMHIAEKLMLLFNSMVRN